MSYIMPMNASKSLRKVTSEMNERNRDSADLTPPPFALVPTEVPPSHPWQDWRWVAAVGGVIIVVISLFGVITALRSVTSERDELLTQGACNREAAIDVEEKTSDLLASIGGSVQDGGVGLKVVIGGLRASTVNDPEELKRILADAIDVEVQLDASSAEVDAKVVALNESLDKRRKAQDTC